MRSIQVRLICGLLSLLLLPLMLAACGSGGGGDAGSSAGTGTVSISLTDDQSGYDAVVLTIKEVGIVASNSAATYYNSSALDALPLTVNVLDFPGDATLPLAEIEVPLPENGAPLCFKQIRLVLAAEGDPVCDAQKPCNYVVESGDTNGTAHELKTPSGQQSGVKILTTKDFCVDADHDTVQVALDFDPSTAIVHNANNGNSKDKYLLKPTGIRMIEGQWSIAPDSFITGMIAVPTAEKEEAGVCEELATTPLVTVAAFAETATVTPVVQTVAMAEGPVGGDAVCFEWCAEEADPASCASDCESGLQSSCYYSGRFKLLLPAPGIYYLDANWGALVSEEIGAEDQDVVLLELK